MRGTKIGIIALAAAGLVLAGCSDADDGTTTRRRARAANPAPDDSPSEDAPRTASGEASGELVDWAGELLRCGRAAPGARWPRLTEDFADRP